MVFVEVGLEVFADILAERFLHEADIVFDGGFVEGGAEEIAGAGHDVVLEPLAIKHGDDAVLVGR